MLMIFFLSVLTPPSFKTKNQQASFMNLKESVSFRFRGDTLKQLNSPGQMIYLYASLLK